MVYDSITKTARATRTALYCSVAWSPSILGSGFGCDAVLLRFAKRHG